MSIISRHMLAKTELGLLNVRVCYTQTDPYAVTFRFTNGMEWLCGRDLLLAGMLLPEGDGDVRVRPVPAGVELTLSSPSGLVVLVFDYEPLLDVLQETLRLVPEGSETVDFDAEFAKLVSRNDY